MNNICQYANKVDDELYICKKHRCYCYFEDPNEVICKETYGDEYKVGSILDDEDNIEDNI